MNIKMSKIKARVTVFLIASVAWQIGMASVPDDRTIADLLKFTDSLVFGKVVSAHGACADTGPCGMMRYEVKAQYLKKGTKIRLKDTVEYRIEFCASESLSLGGRYYLFLSTSDKKDNSGFSGISKEAIRGANCNLIANHDGIFQVIGDNEVYRSWSKDAFITIDYEDKMLGTDRTYFTFGYEYPKFKDELQLLLKAQ